MERKGQEEHLGEQEGVSQEGTFGSWKLRLLACYNMKDLLLFRTAVIMLFLRVKGKGMRLKSQQTLDLKGFVCSMETFGHHCKHHHDPLSEFK